MPPSELVIHEDHALDPGAVVLREKAPAEVESRRRCVREIVAKVIAAIKRAPVQWTSASR